MVYPRNASAARSVTFFHPYCSAGGGGERVLWVTVAALLRRSSSLTVFIYSGEELSKQGILDGVGRTFGITFNEAQIGQINILRIYSRPLLEAKW
jgi:alpha-1,2-mannosyltransferase